MTHTFVARMKVHPHKIKEFVDACERMERAVKQFEPDTYIYKFYRLREPNAFAVIESFKDEAADRAHQEAPHFKEIAPVMIACLDGGYTREYLDPLK